MARAPTPREEAIHAAIADFLRVAAHPRLLWWHTPNSALERVSQRIRFSKLGTLPGMSDFCFVLPDRTAAFMEVKNALGLQSEAQQNFQARCAVLGLPYAIVRDVWEAKAKLGEWGALR